MDYIVPLRSPSGCVAIVSQSVVVVDAGLTTHFSELLAAHQLHRLSIWKHEP